MASKYEEANNYFKARMEESRKIWASRGKEARIKAHAERMSSGVKTWRQMSGLPLMVHEMSHAGNRPFMLGFL
jgi:pyridoxine/pyridoxamine 5'-phosphate oxidase